MIERMVTRRRRGPAQANVALLDLIELVRSSPGEAHPDESVVALRRELERLLAESTWSAQDRRSVRDLLAHEGTLATMASAGGWDVRYRMLADQLAAAAADDGPVESRQLAARPPGYRRALAIAVVMSVVGLRLVEAVVDASAFTPFLVAAMISSALLWSWQARRIGHGRSALIGSIVFGAASSVLGAAIAGLPFMTPLGSLVAVGLVLQTWYVCVPVGMITGLLVWCVVRPMHSAG